MLSCECDDQRKKDNEEGRSLSQALYSSFHKAIPFFNEHRNAHARHPRRNAAMISRYRQRARVLINASDTVL